MQVAFPRIAFKCRCFEKASLICCLYSFLKVTIRMPGNYNREAFLGKLNGVGYPILSAHGCLVLSKYIFKPLYGFSKVLLKLCNLKTNKT